MSKGKTVSVICGGCNTFVADVEAAAGACPKCGRVFGSSGLQAKDHETKYRDKPTLSRSLDKVTRTY